MNLAVLMAVVNGSLPGFWGSVKPEAIMIMSGFQKRSQQKYQPKAGTPLRVQIPAAFSGLFLPSRYIVFYGGRDGAKSWSFANALLIKAAR